MTSRDIEARLEALGTKLPEPIESCSGLAWGARF